MHSKTGDRMVLKQGRQIPGQMPELKSQTEALRVQGQSL